MAAQFTEVTLEDMEKFLKRAFRILRPKKGDTRAEVYYDLSLSHNVVIRVWTSISELRGVGAGVGQDAIRVQLISLRSQRPLMKGKAPIVKRTQNWRSSLQEKIEDMIEAYEEKDEYWEARAVGETAPAAPPPEPPKSEPSQRSHWDRGRDDEDYDEGFDHTKAQPPRQTPIPGDAPTDKQIKYLKYLLSRVSEHDWDSRGFGRLINLPNKPNENELRNIPRRSVSNLIDALLRGGFGQRYAGEEFADDDGSSGVTADS
jgi:hypothetical protein